jgi:hypothetical protein
MTRRDRKYWIKETREESTDKKENENENKREEEEEKRHLLSPCISARPQM